MTSLTKRILTLLCLYFALQQGQAQLFNSMGRFHNQVFVGSGYTLSFGNVSYGFNHTRYFKRLKKDIVGILDFSSPLSSKYYTRFVFRKGFQFSVYKKGNFVVPISIITASVQKHLTFFNFHDFTTELYIMPGIYKPKYTLGAETSLRVLWRHKTHMTGPIDVKNPPPAMTNNPVNLSAGIVYGYNMPRLTVLFRGGYHQALAIEYIKAPFYAFAAVAYKFNFIRKPL